MRLILSITFIVVAVALFFVAVNPIYSDVKVLRTDVATYNTALSNSTELQQTRDSLVEIYKNIKKEDRDRLSHFLPSTINNIELILEIEKIANLHGLPIKNISFDTKNTEKKSESSAASEEMVVAAEEDPSDYLPYGVFTMNFVIEGKYDSFLVFLNDLEHNLRLVDIKSVSFTVPVPSANPTDTTNPNIYSYKLEVNTYWLK
jgi:hypothetical protein